MAIIQFSVGGARSPADEVASAGSDVARVGGVGSFFPNLTCWQLDDSSSGADTVLVPKIPRGVTSYSDRGWCCLLFEVQSTMDASKTFPLLRTQNQAVNRAGQVLITTDASSNHKLVIADLNGNVLATGSTVLTVGDGYIGMVYMDDSGSNREITVYLWDGSAFQQEVTYSSGGGVGATPFATELGVTRAKGAAASGGK